MYSPCAYVSSPHIIQNINLKLDMRVFLALRKIEEL
jgi:hypothetical protein